MANFVDATRFMKKIEHVKYNYLIAVEKSLTMSAQEVYDKAVDNLSGPGIHPNEKGSNNSAIGEMPVPRRTGNLARSMKNRKLSRFEYAIYSDERTADYAKFVHDGTRRMRPRRFLGDVVRERGPAIENRIRYETLKAIRAEGRK